MKQSALASVASACAVTRAIQQKLERVRQVTKDDRSPVTVADFAAQAVVALKLMDSFGEIRMVGEESAGVLRQDDQKTIRNEVVDAVRGVLPGATEDDVLEAIDAGNHDASADAYWTLDPIDGTKGFLRGGQYAVSLAYIEDGIVTLGVMGCPNLSPDFERDFNDDPDQTGLLYFATRSAGGGAGAFVVPADRPEAAPEVVKVQSASERIRVCESVETGHTRHDDTARIVELLGGAGTPARLDSQCKYAVVARGQADAYLRLPTKPGYVEKIWDHAAGKLVAEEAGVIVTDIAGAPLDFSCGSRLERNRGVICAAKTWHSGILEAIDELQIAQPA